MPGTPRPTIFLNGCLVKTSIFLFHHPIDTQPFIILDGGVRFQVEEFLRTFFSRKTVLRFHISGAAY